MSISWGLRAGISNYDLYDLLGQKRLGHVTSNIEKLCFFLRAIYSPYVVLKNWPRTLLWPELNDLTQNQQDSSLVLHIFFTKCFVNQLSRLDVRVQTDEQTDKHFGLDTITYKVSLIWNLVNTSVLFMVSRI